MSTRAKRPAAAALVLSLPSPVGHPLPPTEMPGRGARSDTSLPPGGDHISTLGAAGTPHRGWIGTLGVRPRLPDPADRATPDVRPPENYGRGRSVKPEVGRATTRARPDPPRRPRTSAGRTRRGPV